MTLPQTFRNGHSRQLLRSAVVVAASRRDVPSLENELRALKVASRKQIVELIRKRRVSINGEACGNRKALVGEEDSLNIDGVMLDRRPPAVLKFHKPSDVISSMSDNEGRKDLSSAVPGLMSPWLPNYELSTCPELQLNPWIAVSEYHPVGRLDMDTTGLLLFSRDGKLTQRLLSPANEVTRCYVAIVDGDVSIGTTTGEPHLADRLQKGVRTNEGIFPAKLLEAEVLPAEAAQQRSRVVLQVWEGRYRMVRKMLFNSGFPVLELHRQSYGGIELSGLELGAISRLTPNEETWVTSFLASKRQERTI